MIFLNNTDNPAPESIRAKKNKNPSQTSEIQTLSFKLMIIIAAVVLMLAVVNGLTKDRIAENNKKASDEARTALFADADMFEQTDAKLPDNTAKYVEEIFEATQSGNTVGYCVTINCDGFGGKINMIVGISTDGIVTGVKIISHSETPGVGERIISNGSIVSQLTNVSANSINSVSAITGASITSNAVIEGVTKALEAITYLSDEGGL